MPEINLHKIGPDLCKEPLCRISLLKELGHHISDHDAINSTAILFLPYKVAISLDYWIVGAVT